MRTNQKKVTTRIRVNFRQRTQFVPKIQVKAIPREPLLLLENQERALRFAIALAAAVLLLALVSGCKPANAQQQPAMQPPAVTVANVEQQGIEEWDEFTGRTEAVEAVEVRPRVSGHIQEVRFQSGQLVKKGDVLFVIDPRWHHAEFDRREAEFAQAKVRLENAEREAERTEQLLASKAISTEEGDTRVARFNEAKAALLAVQAARH